MKNIWKCSYVDIYIVFNSFQLDGWNRSELFVFLSTYTLLV